LAETGKLNLMPFTYQDFVTLSHPEEFLGSGMVVVLNKVDQFRESLANNRPLPRWLPTDISPHSLDLVVQYLVQCVSLYAPGRFGPVPIVTSAIHDKLLLPRILDMVPLSCLRRNWASSTLDLPYPSSNPEDPQNSLEGNDAVTQVSAPSLIR
jgi:hypothetical protein